MKTMVKKCLVGIMMIMSLMASAKEHEPFVRIQNEGYRSFILFVNRLGSNEVQINIKDAKQQLLHSEVSKNGRQFSKKFDFTIAPAGTYYIEVEDDRMISVTEINVTATGIAVDKEEQILFFKPSIRSNNKIVDVNFLSQDKGSIRLKIFDGFNKRVYYELLNSRPVLGRRYDLSRLSSGHYTFKVEMAGRSFTRTVFIN